MKGLFLTTVSLWLAPLAVQTAAGLDKIVTVSPRQNWSLEIGSGAAFSNVRESHLDNYTYVPVNITAALKLDEISLDNYHGGIFRGYTEFFFRGYWNQIVSGPENRIIGASFGPRYNFVQPGWKWVPFIEAGVGFGFVDSNPVHGPGGIYDHPRGMGQDFNFTFSIAIGARYDIDEICYLRVSAFYQHFSNAGLSEPRHNNRAIDSVGPEVAFGLHF
ncbi:MAG: acyloxyacyl hydrolase [Verrucomicrobiales bacterium]|nr:acyloxyacyl hydrolase [Verrucomicrobiales bacterium]